MFSLVKEYVCHFLHEECKIRPAYNIRVIKAALVYQCLYLNYIGDMKSLDDILIKHSDIGLIGLANGYLTQVLGLCLNKSQVFCTHAILHYAYGRFHVDYQQGLGYCYALKLKYVPRFVRSSPLLGHITGLLFCISHRI